MRPTRHRIAAVLWLVPALLFTAAAGEGKEPDERTYLLKKRDKLEARIDRLYSEQDFLLFRKAMYDSDSRYLVLHLASGEGQLRYKDRLLRGFRFTLSSKQAARAPGAGAIRLADKVDGRDSRRAMIYGDNLILQTRKSRTPVRSAQMARLYLDARDLNAIFYALEEGSPAYILR